MMADMILCMGGGIGAAGGFSEVTDQKVIAFAGDSTFFHGGITPLVSALFNGHKFVTVILDNRATAMTGHQPHPGTGREHGGRSTEPIDIETLVKGLGVKYVVTVDPYDVGAAVKVMTEAIEYDGLAVVIAKRACPLELKRKKLLEQAVCEINQDACRKCSICISSIACPALMKKDGIVSIDRSQCMGCMMCGNVCPASAIKVIK
jgi:indolepyruvate ferredoxin oxidoreductase alpha subunit